MKNPGWWARHWKWAIPAGILTLMAAGGGLIVLLLVFVMGLVRDSEVYRTAVDAARSEPAVVAALGGPLEEGLLVTGHIEVNGPSGHADLAIPITGPEGAATIYAVADRSRGRWRFDTLEVALHGGGERIDLLADR